MLSQNLSLKLRIKHELAILKKGIQIQYIK